MPINTTYITDYDSAIVRYNPASATVSGQVAYLKQQIASVSATPIVIETDPISPIIIAKSI